MARLIKICSPYPPALTRRSPEQAATDERVDNVRVFPLPSARSALGAPRAAVERLKLWENGRRLRVKFIDGIAEVKIKVESIAKEWEAIANLQLDFIASGASDIRISFAEKGFSWSSVGTDALTVGSTRATMNFGWLEPNTQLREYQRVVRHEFGHALGMIHEHQNPAAQGQIPWDKPKVYAHYAQQGWSTDDVDSNLFAVYSEDSTNHTAFDRTSIMEYALPDALTIGSYAIGWNTEFSATDIEFMRRQYPKGAPSVIELAVGSARTSADLSTGGEVDTFHFDISTPGSYIMTTDGPIDTVLTLHGPNDPGAVLAWDDDHGKGLNARIVRKLYEGSYWLTVRHKSPGGIGRYSVGVKKSG